MACEDDNYGLDADGNRILIGLTLDETREFEGLDELISTLNPVSPVPTNDVLYEKHETALRLTLITPK
jgi:hypothetical protein